MHEKEMSEHIQKLRGEIMSRFSGYDSNESHGSSNDNLGAYSEEPLPFIPLTEETEDGFMGLDPPMN